MPLPLSTDATPAGTPAPKTRAPSLIAEALRALAERNRALGLPAGGNPHLTLHPSEALAAPLR
jgi:hypothetical protein